MSKAAGSKLLALVAAAAALLAVCGCGGDSATETASAPQSTTTAAGGGGGQKPAPSARPGALAKSGAGEATGGQAPAAASPAAAPAGSKPGTGKATHIVPPKGPREPEPTARERAQATVASINLSSPALQPGPESVSTLPATYTCDGKDTWPTLHWSGVPAGTAELVLLVLNLEPVDEAFFFDWAVAGLGPGLEGLDSGRLPKGAVLGRNSFGKDGYSICPAQGPPETIIFALYALPAPLGARKGFDPAALRKEILDSSGNAGLMAVSYGRG